MNTTLLREWVGIEFEEDVHPVGDPIKNHPTH
jgi:hypothetical protein